VYRESTVNTERAEEENSIDLSERAASRKKVPMKKSEPQDGEWTDWKERAVKRKKEPVVQSEPLWEECRNEE